MPRRLFLLRPWFFAALTLVVAWPAVAGSPAELIHVKVHARVLHQIDTRLFGQFMEKASWGSEIGSETAVIPGTHELRP